MQPILSRCKVDPSHLLGQETAARGAMARGASEGIEFLSLLLEVGVGGLAGEEDNYSGAKGVLSSWAPG